MKKENLGARSLYCIDKNTYKSFPDVMKKKKTVNIIQPSSVLSFMKKNYIIGDETMIIGVKKEPWMHKYDIENDDYVECSLPIHNNLIYSVNDIANKFKCLLLDEARSFLDKKNTVGILLSGGMDSRVVAGILKYLQDIGEYNGTVIALTWGIEGTRDVLYAKEIAEKFKWEHIHFSLSAEKLLENISITAHFGAEFSPLHLHAMNDVAKLNSLDGILAGSYGDSIGRAEFSGKKVDSITSILNKDFNKFAILNDYINTNYQLDIENQVSSYYKKFPRQLSWQYNEIEQQCHYMRRQLGACMNIIDNNIPLYQMFTAPEVFGYMWSLDSKCRTNYVYEELLKILPGDLLLIPWARDGKIYPNVGDVLDNHASSHNLYGRWLRNECYDNVQKLLNNDSLDRINLFNPYSLNDLRKNWHKCSNDSADRLDERISWLASFSIFINEYNIEVNPDVLPSNEYLEKYKYLLGKGYRYIYRNAKKIK